MLSLMICLPAESRNVIQQGIWTGWRVTETSRRFVCQKCDQE